MSAKAAPRQRKAASGSPSSARPDAAQADRAGQVRPAETPPARAYLAALAAWALPGAGHWFLDRPRRALVYFALVLTTLAIGCYLDGRLPWQWSGSPLMTLATLGAMGVGTPYFALRFGLGYEGVVGSGSYEYGSAFILTAGLMNLLLVLDAWDVALGAKP